MYLTHLCCFALCVLQIDTVAPWDGQDGKLEVVEEFSLEDLDL